MRGSVRTDAVETWVEPKRSGGHRTMALLSESDAARWQAVADRVVGLVERALGPEVLANRSSSTLRWRPEPLRRSYRRMRDLVQGLASRAEAVVRTDVRDFYGSISPCVLHDSLRGIGTSRRDAALAADLVEGWGSEGVRGLPIGPTPSALLANVVLAPIDAALRPWRFLRWVDDMIIAADDARGIPESLERLDLALDRVGLRRAAAKTAVGGGRGFAWLGVSFEGRGGE